MQKRLPGAAAGAEDEEEGATAADGVGSTMEKYSGVKAGFISLMYSPQDTNKGS